MRLYTHRQMDRAAGKVGFVGGHGCDLRFTDLSLAIAEIRDESPIHSYLYSEAVFDG